MNSGTSTPRLSDIPVEVAVFSPMRGLFTYRWPASLGEPEPGLRVRVPFGRSVRNGLLIKLSEASPEKGNATRLKEVLDRLDVSPLYDADRLRWLARAARYYASPPGEFAETAMGWAAAEDKRRWRILNADDLREYDAELAEAFGKRRALSAGALRRKLPREAFYHRLGMAAHTGLVQEVCTDLAESGQTSQGR
ncbi:MAG: hypothetical protein Q9M30_09840, partial [Mariprofundaceae bacterium]|nr:hypothetical protein [Mariprofundaceae bacterium]